MIVLLEQGGLAMMSPMWDARLPVRRGSGYAPDGSGCLVRRWAVSGENAKGGAPNGVVSRICVLGSDQLGHLLPDFRRRSPSESTPGSLVERRHRGYEAARVRGNRFIGARLSLESGDGRS